MTDKEKKYTCKKCGFVGCKDKFWNQSHWFVSKLGVRKKYEYYNFCLVCKKICTKNYYIGDRYKFTHSKSQTKYYGNNPEKVKAHRLLNQALINKTLVILPCEVCGSTNKIQAHHDDYSKPLNVRWLCAKHHIELHTAQRRKNDKYKR
jgi:hypothetical protein